MPSVIMSISSGRRAGGQAGGQAGGRAGGLRGSLARGHPSYKAKVTPPTIPARLRVVPIAP